MRDRVGLETPGQALSAVISRGSSRGLVGDLTPAGHSLTPRPREQGMPYQSLHTRRTRLGVSCTGPKTQPTVRIATASPPHPRHGPTRVLPVISSPDSPSESRDG